MGKFIELRGIFLSKKEIEQININALKFPDDEKELKPCISIKLKSGEVWNFFNPNQIEKSNLRRHLKSNKAHEKITAIKYYILSKPGRQSAADKNILNIINQ